MECLERSGVKEKSHRGSGQREGYVKGMGIIENRRQENRRREDWGGGDKTYPGRARDRGERNVRYVRRVSES